MKSLLEIDEHTTAEDIRAAVLAGADPNAVGRYGWTPLHVAKNAEQTKALLAGGADVNALDESDMTPLHAAKNAEQTKALLASGAKVNARDEVGRTPLHLAKDVEQARALLEGGAVVTVDLTNDTRVVLARAQITASRQSRAMAQSQAPGPARPRRRG